MHGDDIDCRSEAERAFGAMCAHLPELLRAAGLGEHELRGLIALDSPLNLWRRFPSCQISADEGNKMIDSALRMGMIPLHPSKRSAEGDDDA